MSIFERIYSNTYGVDAYNRFVQANEYMTARETEYAIPDSVRIAKDSLSKRQTALAYAKQAYMNSDEPSSLENRMDVADFVMQLYPNLDYSEALESAENLMYQATGYEASVDNYWKHLNNTFHSAGSGMMAGMKAALLYISGGLQEFGPEWQEEKLRAMNEINTKYAMNYNAEDKFTDGIFKEIGTATASLAPSMLMSMGIGVAGGVLSGLTGGSAIPVMLGLGAKTGSSVLSNIIRFGTLGIRFGTAGMMDAGGTMIEMSNAGFDDDVTLGTGLGIMLASGTVEALGDKAFDTALKPLLDVARSFRRDGSRIITDAVKKAVKDKAKEAVKDTGKSMFTESAQEVLQEFSGMIGYNIALGIEKERGRVPDDIKGYTAEDFGNAFLETIKQTALGTLGFGLATGTARILGTYGNAELSRRLNANNHTTADGADTNILTSDIRIPKKDIGDVDIQGRTAPISVVKIGNKYYPVNPTDEQISAMRKSSRIYAKAVDMSSETVLGHKISRDESAIQSPMSADTVLATIESGIFHDEIAGFTFYDDSMNPVTDMSKAAYASIVTQSDKTTPIIVRLTTDNDSQSQDSFEKALFGRTLAAPEYEKQSVKNLRNQEKKRKSNAKSATKSSETKTAETKTSEAKASEETSDKENNADGQRAAGTDTEKVQDDDSGRDGQSDSEDAGELFDEDTKTSADSIVNEILGEEIPGLTKDNTEATQNEATELEETLFDFDNEPVQETVETALPEAETAADIADDNIILPEDSPTPEQERINSERAERVAQFNQAREEWEATKKLITGKDRNNDIDVLAKRFKEVLSKTKVGSNEKLLDATARASAIIMSGFMRASGMTGKEYFDTLKGFITGGKIPYVGEDGKIYFHTAYHGSAADFNKFSTDFIGTGEGAQAFGWGLYFSDKKGVSRGYAEIAIRENPYYEYIYRLSGILNKYNPGYINVFGSLRRQELIDRINREINNINLNISANELTIKSKLASEDEINYAKTRIPQYKAELEELNLLIKDIEATLDNQRNLYTVEIPNGKYIKWFEPVEKEIFDIISADDLLNKAYGNYSFFINIDEAGIENWNTFGDMYKEVSNAYENYTGNRGDEYISKLLNKHGYAGIIYPIGTVRGGYNPNATDMNYVIFNEDDVKITDHIYFQQQSGDKIGWFMSDEQLDRYIGIMENADPTTLSHELGHHFLSVLAPDNPYYQRIARIYRKQLKLDGGIFGENVQEAFCKDLENYIKGRRSANKELNSLFQKIYDIGKAIWNSFRDVLGLSDEKKQLFDSIFREETVSEEVQTAQIKAEDKAASSPAPSTAIVNELVPDAPKEQTVQEEASETSEQAPETVTDISTLGISEAPVFTSPEASPFAANDSIEKGADGKKSRADGIVTKLNDMNLIRFGSGKYFITNEEQKTVASLMSPEADAGNGSAVSSYLFRYKTREDGRFAEESEFTGTGIGYVIKLDDGSYRNVQFYVGAEPYSVNNLGNAKNTQQALGNPLKNKETGIKANWKKAEKKKKPELKSKASKKAVEGIPKETVEKAMKIAEAVAENVSENTPEYPSQNAVIVEEKDAHAEISEFVSPDSIQKAEYTPDEPTADMESETGTEEEYWTVDDLLPTDDDYVFNLDMDESFFDIKNKNTVADNIDNLVDGEHKPEKEVIKARSSEIESYGRNIYGWTEVSKLNGKNIYTNKKPNLVRAYTNRTVYDYISKMLGIPVDGSFAEIYGDENGSLFVKLKKEIGTSEDKKNTLLDMKDPMWMYIPFYDEDILTNKPDDGLSIDNISQDTGLSDKFIDAWTDKDLDSVPEYSGKEYAPELVAASVLYDYAELVNRRTEAAIAYSGEGHRRTEIPHLYFATSSDKALGEEGVADNLAMYIIDNLSDTKIRGLYNRFTEKYEKAREDAKNQFEADYRRDLNEYSAKGDEEMVNYLEYTHDEQLDSAIVYAIEDEFGVSNGDVNKDSIFRAYLMKDKKIAEYINNIDDSNGMVMDSLVDYLKMSADSYTSTSLMLKQAIANEKFRNNGKKLINSMIMAFRAAAGDSYATEANTFASEFFGKRNDIKKIWTKIKKLGTSEDLDNALEAVKDTISDNEWLSFFAALVDKENGIPAGLIDNGENTTSPLIVLSNYLAGYNGGKLADVDSFRYAGDRFISFSRSMLADRINELNRNRETPIPVIDGGEDRYIISRLATLFAKAGGKLREVFNKSTSINFTDAIIASLDDKIRQLKERKEQIYKDTASTDALNSEIKTLNRQIAALQRRIEDYQKSSAESAKKNSSLATENRNLKNRIAEIGTENYMETLDRIRDLERKLKAANDKLEKAKNDKKEAIANLESQIQQITSSDIYKTAKEIKQAFDDLQHRISRLSSSGDARLSVDLTRIVRFLSKASSKKIPEDMFRSRFTEYDPILETMRKSLVDAGIITEEGEVVNPARPNMTIKKGVVKTGLRGMGLEELSKFVDIVSKARRSGVAMMKQRQEDKQKAFRDMEVAAVNDIPGFESASSDEITTMTDAIRDENMPGSIDYEELGHGRPKLRDSVRLIEPHLKRLSPTLHAYIFGGSTIDGKYNENNLNTAYDRRARATIDRMKALTSRFSDLFNEKAEDFEVAARRIFATERITLGRKDHSEFAKERDIVWDKAKNIADGHPEYEALARTISDIDKRFNKALSKEELTREEEMSLKAEYARIMSRDVDKEYTMEQLMAIYLYARQEGGLRRLIPTDSRESNNIPIESILWVIDQFENNPDYKPYKEFADYIQSVIAARYDEIADVYFNMTGKILSRQNYYFGLASLNRDMIGADTVPLNGKNPGINYSIADWFTEERLGSGKALDLHIISLASSAIRAQETYINLAEPLYNLRKLLDNNSDFTIAFEKTHGRKGTAFIKAMMEWVNRQMMTPMPSTDPINKMLGFFRRNRTASLLMGNMSTILQQYPTTLLAGKETGMINVFNAIREYVASPSEMSRFVYERSAQMEERARLETAAFHADMKRLTSSDSANKFMAFLRKHGLEDRFVFAQEIMRKLTAKLMKMQNSVDRSVANIMWIAYYNHAKMSMDSTGLTPEVFEQMCSEYATQRVLSTNPSANAKDNAIIYSDPDNRVRELILFTSQLNKQFNIVWNDFDSLVSDHDLDSLVEFTRGVLYVGLMAAMAAFISGRTLKDDDDDDEWYSAIGRLMGATGAEMIGMVPLAGPLVRDSLTGDVYIERGVAGDIANLIKVVFKDPEDRKERQMQNAVMSVFGDLSQVVGFPGNAARKLYNVFTADDEVLVNPGELINSKWGDAVNRWFG